MAGIPLLGVEDNPEMEKAETARKEFQSLKKRSFAFLSDKFIHNYKKGSELCEEKPVFLATSLNNDESLALKVFDYKKMKEPAYSKTFRREVNCLKKLKHENIIVLKDVLIGERLDSGFLALELCHISLASVLDDMKIPFAPIEIKNLMRQLFSGIEFIHRNNVIHRDINPTNLLLTKDSCLKIADFGLARITNGSMTPNVGTLWYQAPEILFGVEDYDESVDVWSAGCIFGEMMINKPMFNGKSEMETISLIIDLLGTPKEQIMPGFDQSKVGKNYDLKLQPYNMIPRVFAEFSEGSIQLLASMLRYSKKVRLTAEECKASMYFEESPPACENCQVNLKILLNQS